MTLWQILPVLYLAVATTTLVLRDVRSHRLPNAWVFPGVGIVVMSWAGLWISTGDIPVVSMLSAGGYFLFMLVLAIAGGMGMGDVKLAFVLGAITGAFGLMPAVLSPVVAFVSGGIVSAGILLSTQLLTRTSGTTPWQATQQRRIAFGPFMLAGAWAALIVQWATA
jgi:leader peptidase (prepilin peptidase) / N-methyltransferase